MSIVRHVSIGVVLAITLAAAAHADEEHAPRRMPS